MIDKPDKETPSESPDTVDVEAGEQERAFSRFMAASAGQQAASLTLAERVTLDGPVTVQPRHPAMELSRRLKHFKELARGGMATILTARDVNLQRTVAVKQVRPGSEKQAQDMGRLIAEAQILAQLDHPNIVPVYELCAGADGDLYYTMKLVRGKNLCEILDRQDCLFRTPGELFELVQIFLKVCDAVSFAHSRGVIHRDLKPENIMVGEYGEVYLMDWGIARLVKDAGPVPGGEGDEQRQLYNYEEEQEGRVVGSPGFIGLAKK